MWFKQLPSISNLESPYASFRYSTHDFVVDRGLLSLDTIKHQEMQLPTLHVLLTITSCQPLVAIHLKEIPSLVVVFSEVHVPMNGISMPFPLEFPLDHGVFSEVRFAVGFLHPEHVVGFRIPGRHFMLFPDTIASSNFILIFDNLCPSSTCPIEVGCTLEMISFCNCEETTLGTYHSHLSNHADM